MLAGEDDPTIRLSAARLLAWLIPDATMRASTDHAVSNNDEEIAETWTDTSCFDGPATL